VLIKSYLSIYDTMENIIEPTKNFDFSQLNLENPTPMQGGNFFTKLNYTDKKLPLYVQMPKCKPKQGIIKNSTSKKSHLDLLYNYYDTELISWFEHLEIKCRELIFNKKDNWFVQTEMTLDDIENNFISPTKSYKSGKMIIIRTHIPYTKQIKKDYCMIYDENERVLDTSSITELTELIPLICIDGIKFSSKSFQIDILLPQIMVLCIQDEIKNGFMIKQTRTNTSEHLEKSTNSEVLKLENSNNLTDTQHIQSDNPDQIKQIGETIPSDLDKDKDKDLDKNLDKDFDLDENLEKDKDKDLEKGLGEDLEKEKEKGLEEDLKNDKDFKIIELPIVEIEKDLQEVYLDVENSEENISLKPPSEVYYEIYKAAREKAKHMRQAAVDAYLEARKIKNTYMLHDFEESEDNLSEDEENSVPL